MSWTYKEQYKDDPAPDGPHGWIQWKGTDVCIDLHCSCGHHGHVDAEFFYAYECECGKQYVLGQHIKLLPMQADYSGAIQKDSE